MHTPEHNPTVVLRWPEGATWPLSTAALRPPARPTTPKPKPRPRPYAVRPGSK